MYVTPEEAEKKHCPMARVLHKTTISDPGGSPIHTDSASYNRSKKHVATCLADKCMMWKWGSNSNKPRRGYCSLAQSQMQSPAYNQGGLTWQ